MRRWRTVAIVMTGALLGTMAIGAGIAGAVPDQAGTYADFSRITERSAGQFGAPGAPPSQWSWRTDRPGEYSISWDKDEPQSRERFIRSSDGNWLFIDGWSDNGTYYRQRVTSESVGDKNCNNMTSIPSNRGRQHYVQWNIPAEGYCLDASGTVTEQSSGKRFNFRHRQVWSPPAPCSTKAFPGRTCIKQHEIWWDDNQHPMRVTLDRDQYLAKGLGMAFKVVQREPSPWSAELRNTWTY